MTQDELYTALKSLGMPVAYLSFVETPNTPLPKPPYITYQFAYSGDMMADNYNYLDISNYQVELYTNKKDIATEKLLQDKFKELCLPYSKIESWLDSEKLNQIIYEIQLIGA